MTAPYTPAWITPSAPGQLSNKRGSTLGGADDLLLKARYINPRAQADQVSCIRVQAIRTNAGGSTIAQDTGWCGVPATNVPNAGQFAAVNNASGNWNGRIYYVTKQLYGSSSNACSVTSAPVTGANVGGWRIENSPKLSAVDIAGNAATLFFSLAIVNGYIYVMPSNTSATAYAAGLYWAQINGDGTIGTWNRLAGPTSAGATTQGTISLLGYSDGSTVAWLWILSTAAQFGTFVCPLSLTTGAPTAFNTTTAIPAVTDGQGGGFFYSRFHGKLFLIGSGGTSAAPTLTVASSVVTAATGALAAWANNATGLPLARSNFGLAWVGDPVNTATACVYVMGGLNAGAQSTVYSITTANLALGNVAWTVGTALTTARSGNGFNLDFQSATGINGVYRQYVGILSTEFQVLRADSPNNGASSSGVSTGLTTGILGSGSSITANSDHTQDIGWTYSGFGQTPFVGGGFLDTDQVTFIVQFTDNNGGDASPAAYTVVKIGQPPTITGVAPSGATTDGQPVVSFQYNAGAGGGPQLTYQIQVKLAGALVFDSGVRYDGINSVQSLIAPFLISASTYTIFVTVFSTDSPISGASVSASLNTTTFTPTMASIPGAPSALTAVPNNAAGLIALAWQNNLPANTGNRIYYRRNGTSTWNLLVDSQGVVLTAFNAMDQLALGVAYDFGVSEINASHAEGAMTTVLNKTIDPVAGGYSVFLHVAGQGTTHFVALLAQDTPSDATKLDMRTSIPFQQIAPVARFGVAHYSELQIRAFLQDLAHFKSLQDLINTAYLGNPVYYRDGFGAMITMAPMADHSLVYKPPQFREVTIGLLQIPNALPVSTALGSALGYPAQLQGSVVPLDPSELIL